MRRTPSPASQPSKLGRPTNRERRVVLQIAARDASLRTNTKLLIGLSDGLKSKYRKSKYRKPTYRDQTFVLYQLW
jgi:hypothetical protein